MAKLRSGICFLRDKTDEIHNVTDLEWVNMEVTVDSGPCETAISENMITHIQLHESQGSKATQKCEAATGQDLHNLGERRCFLATDDMEQPLIMHVQVSEVTKPLLSVTKAADMCYEAVLGKYGGYLLDTENGNKVPIRRSKGNLYVMDLWVRDVGFRCPSSPAHWNHR